MTISFLIQQSQILQLFYINKYIDKVRIKHGIEKVLNFVPQKCLEIDISFKCEHGYDSLFEYLASENLEKIETHLQISPNKDFPIDEFHKVTETILNILNVKVIEILQLGEKFATQEFYQNILDCKSLKMVEFYENENTNADLEIIGK